MANINAQFLVWNESTQVYDKYNWETLSSMVRRTEGGQTVEAALALLEAAVGGANRVFFVTDIAARDALTNLNNGDKVFVRDATADTEVTDGWGFYIWDETDDEFILLTSKDILDINLDWESITGRPTSTPAQIDTAVAASHTHTNAATLNRLGGTTPGPVTVDGEPVFTGNVFTVSPTEPPSTARTPFWFRPVV
jgi:hypothetical protein